MYMYVHCSPSHHLHVHTHNCDIITGIVGLFSHGKSKELGKRCSSWGFRVFMQAIPDDPFPESSRRSTTDAIHQRGL